MLDPSPEGPGFVQFSASSSSGGLASVGVTVYFVVDTVLCGSEDSWFDRAGSGFAGVDFGLSYFVNDGTFSCEKHRGT